MKRLPPISRPLLRWFTWYSCRYMRRHFHALRLSRAGSPPQTQALPLVVFSNHAAWWDPLICLALKAQFYPQRAAFAPIDAAALERYKMFAKLGFFGVERGTVRGASQFLRAAMAVLENPNHLLALTPQGRFADPRERPVRFEAGLGHLATRVESALFVPLALEYLFWEERLPEIVVRFGDPVEVRRGQTPQRTPADWTLVFQNSLATTQDALALEAQRRESRDFHTLWRGSTGQGGVYDWWRSLRAKLRGRSFNLQHGLK